MFSKQKAHMCSGFDLFSFNYILCELQNERLRRLYNVSVSLLLLFRCTNGSVFSMPPIGYMVYVVIKQGKNQQQQLQQRLLKVNKSDRKINSTRNASNKSTKWGKKQQNSGKIGITRKRTTLWNIHIVFVFVFNAERDSSERGRQREKIHQINKL